MYAYVNINMLGRKLIRVNVIICNKIVRKVNVFVRNYQISSEKIHYLYTFYAFCLVNSNNLNNFAL